MSPYREPGERANLNAIDRCTCGDRLGRHRIQSDGSVRCIGKAGTCDCRSFRLSAPVDPNQQTCIECPTWRLCEREGECRLEISRILSAADRA